MGDLNISLNICGLWSKIGAPGPTRTGGLRIRSPTLYPTELRVRKIGVSEGIRTPGRWSHNPELYQLSYAHHKPSNSIKKSLGLHGFHTENLCRNPGCTRKHADPQGWPVRMLDNPFMSPTGLHEEHLWPKGGSGRRRCLLSAALYSR